MENISKIGSITIDTSCYNKAEYTTVDDWKSRLFSVVESSVDLGAFSEMTDEWVEKYHLSPKREKLLSWYDFSGVNRILEIGSGCGALTGFLSKNCNFLVSVDESFRRTQINATRYRNASNIMMRVGNILDMDFHDKFDLVSVIGVFEYIAAIQEDRSRFFELIKTWLTPNGKLLFAIENKYGLKYWSGCPEDHTFRPYDSIEGYPNSGEAVTFSYAAINNMILNAGFTRVRFFYPLPDYKFPIKIFSDSLLPSENDLELLKDYRSNCKSSFDIARVGAELVKDGLFHQFANSFLVEATL